MNKEKKKTNLSSFCIHSPLMSELEKAKYQEKLKQEYGIKPTKNQKQEDEK